MRTRFPRSSGQVFFACCFIILSTTAVVSLMGRIKYSGHRQHRDQRRCPASLLRATLMSASIERGSRIHRHCHAPLSVGPVGFAAKKYRQPFRMRGIESSNVNAFSFYYHLLPQTGDCGKAEELPKFGLSSVGLWWYAIEKGNEGLWSKGVKAEFQCLSRIVYGIAHARSDRPRQVPCRE